MIFSKISDVILELFYSVIILIIIVSYWPEDDLVWYSSPIVVLGVVALLIQFFKILKKMKG